LREEGVEGCCGWEGEEGQEGGFGVGVGFVERVSCFALVSKAWLNGKKERRRLNTLRT
jgi:hypothetical protein